MRLQFARSHARVTTDFGLRPKTHLLAEPGCNDPRTHIERSFTGAMTRDLPKLHRRYLHVDINAIEQWTRDFPDIVLNFPRRTARLRGHFSIRSWVHGSHQHKL